MTTGKKMNGEFERDLLVSGSGRIRGLNGKLEVVVGTCVILSRAPRCQDLRHRLPRLEMGRGETRPYSKKFVELHITPEKNLLLVF